MESRGVLVVGETPSLGRSIADVLEAGGVPIRLVYDVSAAHPLATLVERYPVVVVACNEHFCATVRRWAREEFPGVAVVVVGDRDPGLALFPGLHVVPLPLRPAPFVARVGELLAAAKAVAPGVERSGTAPDPAGVRSTPRP